MSYHPTIVERAFILAASGKFGSVSEVRKALKQEGYGQEGHVHSRSISRQLTALINRARKTGLSGA
jgi:hypothetical protein